MNTTAEWKNADGAPRAPKLLLVEDHEHMARLTRRLLEAEGFEVATAGTFTDALALLRGQAFDLVLSDLTLPDGNGLDLPSRLGPVPALALSGYGETEDIHRSLAAGFAAHLVKPVAPEDLLVAVRQALAPRRACAAGPAS